MNAEIVSDELNDTINFSNMLALIFKAVHEIVM